MSKSHTDLNRRPVLPGDRLATIEEFVPGPGSAVQGENLISTTVGTVAADMSNRTLVVSQAKKDLSKLPKADDYIIGKVQSAATSIAQITIEAVNDSSNSKDLAGMLSLRDDRHRRSSPIKSGDTIRAKVVSTTNSIFHLSLDGENCGVLFTVCSNCGGSVVAISRNRIKCRECGYVDERQLSEDFIAYSRSQK